jgi:hypothetical protein
MNIDQRLICGASGYTKISCGKGQLGSTGKGNAIKTQDGLSGENATFGAKKPLLETFALIIALNYQSKTPLSAK